MGTSGYFRAEYDQLVLDVRSGIPPAKPTLIVTLPMPRHKRPRKTNVSNSSSEDDEDIFGAAEVFICSLICDERILIGANRSNRQQRIDGTEGLRDNIAQVPETASVFQASIQTICFHAIMTSNA